MLNLHARVLLVMLLVIMIPFMSVAAQDDEGETTELAELYRSGDGTFEFNFPTGWVIQTSDNRVFFADSDETFATDPTALSDDQQISLILPVTTPELAAFDVAEDASMAEAVDSFAGQLAEDQALEPAEAVTLGDKEAAYVSWITETNGIQVVGVKVADNLVLFLITQTGVGGLENVEAVTLDIVASFTYRTPQEVAELDAARREAWVNSVYALPFDGSPYYVIAPEGEAPEGGWPTLVAVHGPGQTGINIVERFAPFTEAEGILLVAPTFAPDADLEEGQIVMDNLLETVVEDFSISEDGIVLYGFSGGGSLVTFYTNEAAPDNILGVASEGAPRIFTGSGEDTSVDYLFVYGEIDPQNNSSNEAASVALQELGYRVRYEVIPGGTDRPNPRAVDLTLELVEIVYSEE